MDYISHHGIKGQKWGVRRFQNKDGTRTSLGKKHASELDEKKAAYKSAKKEYSRSFDKAYSKSYQAYSLSKKKRQANDERWDDAANKAEAVKKAKSEYKQAKAKANAAKNNKPENPIREEFKRQKKHIATKRAVTIGANLVDAYLKTHNVTLNGKSMSGYAGTGAAMVNGMLDYKYMQDTFA